MRKLMWFGIGIGIACLFGAYVLSGAWLLLLGVCMVALCIGLFAWAKENKALRCAAFAACGAAVGMLWFYLFTLLSLAVPREADGKVLQISAQATDYSYATQYGVAVEAKVDLDGDTVAAKLYINEAVEIAPGDRIEGEFRLQFTGPDGEEPSTYLSGTGVHLLGYDRGEVTVEARHDTSLASLAPRLRRSILQKIDVIFPADTAVFAKALILGERSDMSYELTTSLTVSGIIHLVAVSGLHVSVLFSLLFSLLGSRRLLTPILGTVFLVFIAAVTGFTPSIVRACLMNGLMLFALLVNREPDGPTALSFSVIVMLLVNPLCVTSVGLQLSVASVAGIQLFADRISGWIQDRKLWGEVRRRTLKHYVRGALAGSVSVSLAAAVTTAPLTALHFGTVSLVGLVTNLLTVSIANIIFVAGVCAVALAYVWTVPARLAAWVLSWGIRYIIWLADLLSSFPLAAVYTESVYIAAWLVFAFVMLGVFLLTKTKRVWLLGACLAATLAAAVGLSFLEPRLDSLRVTMVDVGQGQCVLLQSDGRAYMVDCGGDTGELAADAAVELLFSQGIFSLDGLILTHYDQDHVGGAPYLLSRVPVDAIYIPRAVGWESWICDMDAEVTWVEQDVLLSWDDTQLRIISSAYTESTNESSLCVLYQKDNCDILITGDRSFAGEADLILDGIPQLDILVAGHHGAATSTSEYLLANTLPELVLISAGEGNRYGHPADAVLERLERYGCIVRRTDIEGTITIRR